MTLVGCQSTLEPDNFKYTKPALPVWVVSPPQSLNIVVTIVPRQKASSDPEFQLRAAIISAKAQLASNRSTYIESSFETKRTHSVDGVDSRFSSVGYQSSSQNLNFSQAKVLDKFIDDNGELYILYGMPSGQ